MFSVCPNFLQTVNKLYEQKAIVSDFQNKLSNCLVFLAHIFWNIHLLEIQVIFAFKVLETRGKGVWCLNIVKYIFQNTRAVQLLPFNLHNY